MNDPDYEMVHPFIVKERKFVVCSHCFNLLEIGPVKNKEIEQKDGEGVVFQGKVF